MENSQPSRPECALEALDLLNCVAQDSFDQDKCLNLVHSLRQCVQNKKVKKFTLAETSQEKGGDDTVEKKDG